MSTSKFHSFWTHFKESPLYKIGRFITNSAAIALLITAILFVYQEHEERARTDRILTNLEDISSDLVDVQMSLSTRYLGIFPNYLEQINLLYDGISPRDSVIIFEDVLYYGFLSRPEEFEKMNRHLLTHADSGGKVTIAYYDPSGRTFHRMMKDLLVARQLLPVMASEQKKTRLSNEHRVSIQQRKQEDTLLCRKYFDLTRKSDPTAFKDMIDRMLNPLAILSEGDDSLSVELKGLFGSIDSLKNDKLSQDYMKVDFFDYEDMYKEMTGKMGECYRRHGIELIPLDEYMTMSCWLAGGKAVFAFPSKWATDEIGFFSQDPAFARYITTMLAGIKGQFDLI